ncbi:MAG TPA: amidohydrolase family protein, partial [Parafilimonas sp.]|nr:amidohydrolase family protein [Parafilimonas sp.]
LRVYESVRKIRNDLILRIEHLGLPSDHHLQKMHELNIHCVSQSIFLKELGKNFEQYLEAERLHSLYPYRKILNNKINLALSSDAPVVKDLDPISGIKAAVFRKDIEGNIIGRGEKISLQEAIYAYTLGAAKANGTDIGNGSIEVGKRADFILLNKKLGDVIEENEEIYVKSTFIDGKEVYRYDP